MGNIRLYGSTSGYTELAPPAVAPDGVLSLPSGVGTLLTAEGGKILQIVRATDATLRTTTSTTYVDVTGVSVSITPQRSTSNIIVMANFQFDISGDVISYFQITDSGNTAISGAENAIWYARGNSASYFSVVGYVAAGSTSARTYKLRFRNNTGTTLSVNNSIWPSTTQMFAIEVSA